VNQSGALAASTCETSPRQTATTHPQRDNIFEIPLSPIELRDHTRFLRGNMHLSARSELKTELAESRIEPSYRSTSADFSTGGVGGRGCRSQGKCRIAGGKKFIRGSAADAHHRMIALRRIACLLLLSPTPDHRPLSVWGVAR